MTEALYCYPFEILCQPLSWWSSAASWAQAILSALAIWFAGSFAMRQAKLARQEKLSTYIEILLLADREAQSASRHVAIIPNGATIAVSNIDGSRPVFAKIAEDLESVSFHDLPHRGLVTIIRDAAAACRTLDINYEQNFDKPNAIDDWAKSQIDEAQEMLKNIVADAMHLQRTL